MKSPFITAAFIAVSGLAASVAWTQALAATGAAAPVAGASASAMGGMDLGKGMMDHVKGMIDHAKPSAHESMHKMAPEEKLAEKKK